MPTSPEAGGVVDKLRDIGRGDPEDYGEFWPSECRALLAVVEAAQKVQEARDLVLPQHFKAWLGVLDAEAEALDALYAPDSAEER